MGQRSSSEFYSRALIDLSALFPDLAAEWSVEAETGVALPHDSLPDYSPSGIDQRANAISSLLDDQRKLDSRDTSTSDRENGLVLEFYLRHGVGPSWIGADGHRFRYHDYPVNHFYGAQSMLVALMTQGHRIASAADVEDYLRRLELFPAAIEGLIQSVVFRKEHGIRPPRRAIERVVRELRMFGEGDAEANPLFSSFRNRVGKITISDAARVELLSRVSALISGIVQPAYRRLTSVMEALLADARESPGVWALPEGEAYYDFVLRSHTTITATVDEIHELGHSELSKLRDQIQKKFRSVGLGGSMADNYRALMTDEKHRYEGSAAGRAKVLSDYNDALSLARARTGKLFNTLPAADVRIEPIAEAFENSLTHHYSAPARDGSRPGVFHVNLRQAGDGPRWEVPVITFHETVPGHHLQIALTREMPQLPFFRRVLVFNAYTEGWAKYAETIPFEHGFLDDPYAELGRMRLELYSTVSLILDTGINAKRWSFDDGVSFLKREIGAGDKFAEDMVDRVSVLPGQACSYKIGMIAMEKQRKRMHQDFGAAFDLKAFHSLILGGGSVPLSVLDSIVDGALQNGSRAS